MNRELNEAYALAAVGAVEGVWRYYIRPELTAGRAWAIGGLLVGAYELVAPEGELLSQGVDRALEKHPVAVTAGIGLVALHLMNALPPKYDPISYLHKLRS